MKQYEMYNTDISEAKWEVINQKNGAKFRMAYDDKHLYLELQCDEKRTFVVSPEFQLMWPDISIYLSPNGDAILDPILKKHFSVFGEVEKAELAKYANRRVAEGEGTGIAITFDRTELGMETMRPFRMGFSAGKSWCVDDCPVKSHSPRPGIYGWILPKKSK